VSGFAGAFWDLYPTFLDLAGGGGKPSTTAAIDGVSILPTLEGDTGRQQQHAYLYWEFHENGGRQAVRWGKWKGVRLNVHAFPDASLELYDLSRDLGEKNDVAAQHPDIVEKIISIMGEAHVPDKNWPLGRREEAGP
jgi:arylsulfatase A-like enzyme